MNPVPLLKEDGSLQRSDVTLTLSIASALVEKILTEGKVYTEDGSPILITVRDGDTKEHMEIKDATLRGWVYRDIVIPGDGRKLRDVLNEAREELKRRERDARRLDIIENSEAALAELVKIPITSGKMVTTKFKSGKKGFKAYGKVETEFEGVNPKLAEAKIKAISFGLERLAPERYGAKLETKNSHMIFSLSTLRRAKEARDELIDQPQ